MDALHRLASTGSASPLDVHFGRFLSRHAPAAAADMLALTGALVSAERGRGHTCLRLSDWAGRTFPGEVGDDFPAFPDVRDWTEVLDASGIAGGGEPVTPLVLDSGRLYLYRYWNAERTVAEQVLQRVQGEPDERCDPGLVRLFKRLFPSAGKETDWQAVAAASALRNRFTLVTGGPGTGKTTVVTRMLALLLARDPDLAVELAAPTGKAAARMTESIRAQAQNLDLPKDQRARLSREASTIHRLLGFRPRPQGFRHDAAHPLPLDVLIVDEASMVDLLLMEALFAALPPHGRIVLLGDKDQLASVEAGYVLGDICLAAETKPGFGPGFRAFYETLGGLPLPSSKGGLSDAVVSLQKNYRFESQPHIGSLATALRLGQADQALEILKDPAVDDVSLLPPARGKEEVLAPFLSALTKYNESSTPDQALERLGDFRILCVTRKGPQGVERLNATVETWLRGRAAGDWYKGRPVMVTSNDYTLRLFNGDVGVCWPGPDRITAVHFPDGTQELRTVSPGRMPDHQTAWALTVHKSQGSEFNEVVVLLPTKDNPLLTRELLYTAVTRAREKILLFGDDDIVRAAVERTAVRVSGLAYILGG
jgi:exodeoxyribonuclease V alpha subunit